MDVGYTKAWKKELDSAVWGMPPLYHRIWFWLRQKAKYKVELFTTRRGYGVWLRPGQLLTSLDLIGKGVAWKEHGVERVPNRKTVKDVLDWLAHPANDMIALESNSFGTFINITNWATYQSSEDVKVTRSGQPSKHGLDTYKEEVQEVKEVKEKGLKTNKGQGKPADPRVRQFIDFYSQSYEAQFGHKPLIKGGRDGQTVKTLLSWSNLDDLKTNVKGYFLTDKPFFKENGYDLPRYEKYLQGLKAGAYKGASNGNSKHTGLTTKDYSKGLDGFGCED